MGVTVVVNTSTFNVYFNILGDLTLCLQIHRAMCTTSVTREVICSRKALIHFSQRHSKWHFSIMACSVITWCIDWTCLSTIFLCWEVLRKCLYTNNTAFHIFSLYKAFQVTFGKLLRSSNKDSKNSVGTSMLNRTLQNQCIKLALIFFWVLGFEKTIISFID